MVAGGSILDPAAALHAASLGDHPPARPLLPTPYIDGAQAALLTGSYDSLLRHGYNHHVLKCSFASSICIIARVQKFDFVKKHANSQCRCGEPKSYNNGESEVQA